ncbi:hypothetical protein AB0G54_31885 [Streptomyces yokosukanensis]|uniref:hypothetical protein n=1 Tax=Streptomyces yokosukanensis TaxID=67386 RepID=UPI0034144EE0
MTIVVDAPVRLARPTTGEASNELNRAARAAGLSISPMPEMDRPTEYVDLGKVAPETAAELARLIRSGMRRAYRTVDDLQVVCQAHGLAIPDLSVQEGKIDLGDVSVDAADRLACLLGAPPQPESRLDLNEWSEARKVMDRLSCAFKAATRGGFIDLYFHPDCLRCDTDAAISLGSIPVKTARRLVNALQFGG